MRVSYLPSTRLGDRWRFPLSKVSSPGAIGLPQPWQCTWSPRLATKESQGGQRTRVDGGVCVRAHTHTDLWTVQYKLKNYYMHTYFPNLHTHTPCSLEQRTHSTPLLPLVYLSELTWWFNQPCGWDKDPCSTDWVTSKTRFDNLVRKHL